MAAELQLNPTQPVNQQIYRILRHDIVHCLIPPGTPLSEKEVSVRFSVSRQPVREALSNWLRMVLFKFARAAAMSIRSHFLRFATDVSFAAIECAVVRRAAGMITAEQIYQLEQNLNQRCIAVERQQLNDFFQLDDEFHQNCR